MIIRPKNKYTIDRNITREMGLLLFRLHLLQFAMQRTTFFLTIEWIFNYAHKDAILTRTAWRLPSAESNCQAVFVKIASLCAQLVFSNPFTCRKYFVCLQKSCVQNALVVSGHHQCILYTTDPRSQINESSETRLTESSLTMLVVARDDCYAGNLQADFINCGLDEKVTDSTCPNWSKWEAVVDQPVATAQVSRLHEIILANAQNLYSEVSCVTDSLSRAKLNFLTFYPIFLLLDLVARSLCAKTTAKR